jgi:hypothetical protein
VSVHNGDWYLAAGVSGVLRLGNSAWVKAGRKRNPVPTLYRRASRKAEVSRMLKLMARGDIEAIRKAEWVPREQLPAARKNLFP